MRPRPSARSGPHRATAGLALVAALGCGGGGEASPPAPRLAGAPSAGAASRAAPAAAPEGRVVPTAPAAAPRPPAPELALASIGYPCDLPARTEEAGVANAEALALHEAGDYEASRAGFARAAELAPGWSTPRFNLACALARLGDLESAAAAIEPALLSDLPETLDRLAHDPDLEALRSAEGAAAFHRRLEQIRALYARAEREGLPASCGRAWGIYLRETGRFVPLSRTEGEYGALDLEHRRLAVADAGLVGATETDEMFALEAVAVVPLVPLSGGWASPAPRRYVIPAGAGVMADPTELARGFDVTGAEVRFAGGSCGARWCVLRGRELVPAERQDAAPGPREAVLPDGFALEGDRLIVPEGEPIALGPGHAEADWHTFAIDPARRRLVVASDDLVEGESTYVAFEQSGDLHRTVFDHVELETREVTRLGAGEDVGWTVADGPDCYTVLGRSVRRWPGFAARGFEALPSHGLVPRPRW